MQSSLPLLGVLFQDCLCVCVDMLARGDSKWQQGSNSSTLYFTAELEENSTLNNMVWDAAGLLGNGTFPLEQFSYNNSVLLDVIFRHMQNTNFRGITVSEGKRGVRAKHYRCIDIFVQTLCCSHYTGSCLI